jgi:threonine synthase
VTDAEIVASIRDWASNEGVYLSPEGASVTAAYDKLLADGTLKPADRVVLFNTGSGLKYTEVIAEALNIHRA